MQNAKITTKQTDNKLKAKQTNKYETINKKSNEKFNHPRQ